MKLMCKLRGHDFKGKFLGFAMGIGPMWERMRKCNRCGEPRHALKKTAPKEI